MKNDDANKLNATKPANSTVVGSIDSKLQSNASASSAAPIASFNNETTIINSTVTRIPNNDAPAQLLAVNNNATMSQAPLISLSNSSKPFQSQNITTNDYVNATKGLVDQHPVGGTNASAATTTHNETTSTAGPIAVPVAALNASPTKSDSKAVSSPSPDLKNHQEDKTKKTEKPVKRSPSLSSFHNKKTLYKATKASTRTLRRSKPRSGVLRRSMYIVIIKQWTVMSRLPFYLEYPFLLFL